MIELPASPLLLRFITDERQLKLISDPPGDWGGPSTPSTPGNGPSLHRSRELDHQILGFETENNTIEGIERFRLAGQKRTPSPLPCDAACTKFYADVHPPESRRDAGENQKQVDSQTNPNSNAGPVEGKLHSSLGDEEASHGEHDQDESDAPADVPMHAVMLAVQADHTLVALERSVGVATLVGQDRIDGTTSFNEPAASSSATDEEAIDGGILIESGWRVDGALIAIRSCQ